MIFGMSIIETFCQTILIILSSTDMTSFNVFAALIGMDPIISSINVFSTVIISSLWQRAALFTPVIVTAAIDCSIWCITLPVCFLLQKELRMMSFSDRPIARLCKTCGQFHSPTDSHLYDYHQPIDDDLTCEICLQPLVDPVDTKCGHTFCARCIKNFLKLQNVCPNDRNQLAASDLQAAPIIIRR